MEHDDYQTTLAAHALTALDASEAHEVEAHAENCVDCRDEMNSWQETTALLALGSKPVEPSIQVRAQLMESIRNASANRSSADEKSSDDLRSKSKVVKLSRSQKNSWSSV